jgi:hypothetical protein
VVYLIKVAMGPDLKQQHIFAPRSLLPLIPQTSKRSALKFDILTEPARIIVRMTTDCMLYILMSNTLPRFSHFPFRASQMKSVMILLRSRRNIKPRDSARFSNRKID